MADNVGYTPGVGATVAADEIGGVLHQRVKIGIGADGVAVDLSASNPMPITAPSPLAVTGGLTDAELRATPVPVDGPLTDAELRASAVAVSGPLTDAELRAAPIDVAFPPGTSMSVEDSAAGNLLLRILQMLMAPLGYDKSLQRQRGTVVVETLPTLGNVTTVGTLNNITSLNGIDGYNARMQILDNNRTAWAQCVRSRIT